MTRETAKLEYLAETTLGYRVMHNHVTVGFLCRPKDRTGWIITLSGGRPFCVDGLLDEARATLERRYNQMLTGGYPSLGAV